jgi:hypothetical protein
MSARKVGPDFHLVQLTEEGIALANGNALRISNGRISILFPADGEPVKVARYEWDMLLRDHAHIDGTTLFEIFTEVEPVTDVVTNVEAPAAEAEEKE